MRAKKNGNYSLILWYLTSPVLVCNGPIQLSVLFSFFPEILHELLHLRRTSCLDYDIIIASPGLRSIKLSCFNPYMQFMWDSGWIRLLYGMWSRGFDLILACCDIYKPRENCCICCYYSDQSMFIFLCKLMICWFSV